MEEIFILLFNVLYVDILGILLLVHSILIIIIQHVLYAKQRKHQKGVEKNPNLFLEQISVINPDIEILGEYTTNNCKIQYKCKKCGFVGESTPNHLLQGHGCPQCNISMGEKYIK